MVFMKTPTTPRHEDADNSSTATTLAKMLTPSWRTMTMSLLRKLLTSLCMAVLCLSSGAVAKPADDDFNAQASGFLRSLREKYDAHPELPEFLGNIFPAAMECAKTSMLDVSLRG
jgi:hypothetical protein